MPTSSNQLLPGAHDPHNVASVKLAEATRIRLILPGLEDKEEGSVFKRANTSDLSKLPAESAAAKAKARKKLLKLQGIANQADKAHAAVIIDAGVLTGEDDPGSADGSGSTARSGDAPGSPVTAEKRLSRQGMGGGYTPSVGAVVGCDAGQVKPRRAGARTAVHGGKSSSRLALPSPVAAPVDGDVASSGPQSAAASSRRGVGDKAHVPIWERVSLAPAEDKKPPAMTHKVFQPVAMKTFSPTLNSLGSNLPQDASRAAAEESLAARSAPSRPKGVPKASPAEVVAALQPRHLNTSGRGSYHLSSKRSVDAAPDLALRSKSFTGGYQSPSQLLEKLTLGG